MDKERVWNVLDCVAPIAEAHGCSPARIALAWILTKPAVTSVIVGAKRLDQLEDNLAAVSLELTADEVERLDAGSALAPEYPGWMVGVQNTGRSGQDGTGMRSRFGGKATS